MAQQRFAWQVHLRRDVLDDAVGELRDLPYSVWRDVIDSPLTKTVKGRDDKTYRLDVTADWYADGTEDIEVTVTLKGRWRGPTLRESFVITPDNKFVTET